MGVRIKAINYYIPEICISNEDINKKYLEWTSEKVFSKTGIKNRYIAESNQTAGDLGEKAAIKLFKENHIDPKEIDFLILCTQSPDYFLPTTSCILQYRLGLNENIGAFDFNLGCSGYIYGLSIAKGLIESQQVKNVLLITAETYSKYIKDDDKGNSSIFGDAAAATLIEYSKDNNIDNFVFGTDGSGADNLIVKSGAHRQSFPDKEEDKYLYMNGGEIFSFTLVCVPKLIKEVLKKSDSSIDDFDNIIFHQANKYILEVLRKKCNIPENKFLYFIENCGNTVSSTIPIVLTEAINAGVIKENSKILLAGFGVGYSWGGCTIK